MLRVIPGLFLVLSMLTLPPERAMAFSENWQPVAASGECLDVASIKTIGKFTSWTQATEWTRVDDQGHPQQTCPIPPRQPSSLEVDCTQNLSGTFEQYGFDPKTGQGTEFSQTVGLDGGTQYLRDIANYVCKVAMAKSPLVTANWQRAPGTDLCVDTNSETFIDGMLQWRVAICEKGPQQLHDPVFNRVNCAQVATNYAVTLRLHAVSGEMDNESVESRQQGAAMARFACEHAPKS